MNRFVSLVLVAATIALGGAIVQAGAQNRPESWHGEATFLNILPDPPRGQWSVTTFYVHCMKGGDSGIAFCDDPNMGRVVIFPPATPEVAR